VPIQTTDLIDLIYKHVRLERMQIPQLTRLVKLIYLVELEYFRLRQKRLTNLDWKFHYYGPYPPAFKSILDDAEIQESTWKGGKTSQQLVRDEAHFVEAKGEPDLERLIHRIVKDWGDADLNALLDHVYFETEPMQNARRGDMLDFSLVKEPARRIQIKVDQKRLAELRTQLRERASAYSQIRQRSEPRPDLIQALQTWDDEVQKRFPSGPCSVDVSDLVPKE
jgi:Protein of unknown function (DUF4065)